MTIQIPPRFPIPKKPRENTPSQKERTAMLKPLVLGLTLLALLPASTSRALSDSEYQTLMTAPQFRKAEQELARQWKQTYSATPEQDRKYLLEVQREWIKLGRDNLAQKFQAAGIDKVDAYTLATFRRVGALKVFEYNSNLAKNDQGMARPDDFYDDEMDREAVEAIKETRQTAQRNAPAAPENINAAPEKRETGGVTQGAPAETASAAPSASPRKDLPITAKKLSQEYSENEFSGDNKYKGKRLLLKGTVVEVSKDFNTENVYVLLDGYDVFGSVKCYMANTTGLDMLSRGDAVELTGVCVGYMLYSVIIKNCQLVSIYK